VFHEAKSYDKAQGNRSPSGRFDPIEHSNYFTPECGVADWLPD
jgi:hypothetical protein